MPEMGNSNQEKKVCHISTVHSVTDDRIYYKECVSLAGKGYAVSFVVPHDKDEVRDGVTIVALPEFNNRLVRFVTGSFRALRKGLRTRAELIHIHDPELIPAGLIFKLLGRLVIYDVHELVYHHLAQKQWGNKLFRPFLKWMYGFFEFLAVKFFGAIILVVDDDHFKDYFFTTYRKQVSKFLFIRNYPMIRFTDDLPPSVYEKKGDMIIYAGGLSRERGIQEVIRATGFLSPAPTFILFGKWSDENYREECMREPGWKNVEYMGYRRLEEIYPFIKVADLGIALLYPLKNYLTSLPVKAFEYMTCSVPILMSDFPFWIRKFGDCAYFTDPSSSEKIAEVLKMILADKEMMKAKGRSGRELVEKQYSWEEEEKILVACYDKLFASRIK
jgi:glycosyltransferase involved in cell wall biosynthesis